MEILPLIIGVILAQLAPGPNMLAVSSISLGAGREQGVYAAAGVATGVFIWAILFTFGLGALMAAFPNSIVAMKFIGGGYLLYMGLKAIRNAFAKSKKTTQTTAAYVTSPQAYIKGLLVVITNPKAAMMWMAISLFLASTNLSDILFLAVGLCVSLSALVIYGIYAVLFSTGFAVQIYGRFFRAIETAFGIIFAAAAMVLLADAFEEVSET